MVQVCPKVVLSSSGAGSRFEREYSRVGGSEGGHFFWVLKPKQLDLETGIHILDPLLAFPTIEGTHW